MTIIMEVKHIPCDIRCPRCGRFLCEQRAKGIHIRMVCKCKANVVIEEARITVIEN